ncbi:MAG: SEC-C domain-containing protein, partial [Clostridiales bacterium]|nr:SEC-C domain-containing protein [Clostridiales bacterium]
MTKTLAKKIFDRYNSFKTCPQERADVQESLDICAKAAANLYGVISLKELAEIYGKQNQIFLAESEIAGILTPLVLESMEYCFYKDYLVNKCAIQDFDYAVEVLKQQEGKDLYLPEKEEFLKHADPAYRDEDLERRWEGMKLYLEMSLPGLTPDDFLADLRELSEMAVEPPNGLNDVLGKHAIHFRKPDLDSTFRNLYSNIRDVTRRHIYKGHCYKELQEFAPTPAQSVVIKETAKIKLAAPCPCGSGKEYKDCCRVIEKGKTSQLSDADCALFYEIWFTLLNYVNQAKHVLPETIPVVFPNPIDDLRLYKVREALSRDPSLIAECAEAARMSREKKEILKAWQKYYQVKDYCLVTFMRDHAVAMGMSENDPIYAFKGISRAPSLVMQRKIPFLFRTVMLPFKDMIIFDTYFTV